MARGVSTVVDVSLALLLVSASVVTFIAATPPEREDSRARGAAALVAATTGRVEYSGGNASGTVAGLLVDATAPTTPEGFRDAVRRRAERTLRRVPGPAQVTVRPQGEGQRVEVGAAPPQSADIDAAAFTVGRNGTPVRVVVRTWSA